MEFVYVQRLVKKFITVCFDLEVCKAVDGLNSLEPLNFTTGDSLEAVFESAHSNAQLVQNEGCVLFWQI
jgi:hypothetical protein